MRNYIRKFLPHHEAIHGNRWLAPFANTLLHPRLWHLNRHSVAGAVAAGLFCGMIPGPLQMLGAAICAVIFRVNLPLAMFTTFYTNPLTIVPLYILAYEVGSWVVPGEGGKFVAPPDYPAAGMIAWTHELTTWMVQLGRPLAAGLLLLAVVFSIVGYFVTRLVYRIYLVRAWRHRHASRKAAKC